MTDTMSGVDLTNCDREPIHQLGQIQDFGALIACTSDWIIAHVSANADAILQPRKPLHQGERLADHFSSETMNLLRDRLGTVQGDDTVERIFGVDVARSGRMFDIALHLSDGKIVIELERHEAGSTGHHAGMLRPLMERLNEADDVAGLCQDAAREMKRLLGFDRVMVYRFHADDSGEVIAEAREPHLESFLTLRYPKTDIPQQARRLYLKNLFRIIADVNAAPVPVQPATGLDGRPLDLSLSTLRAVSPIHIEYLQNMGVGASLSISIVIKGKLWGLFACHHYAPLYLNYAHRTLAETFSQLFSLKLEMALATSGNRLRAKAQQLHDRLMARLAGGTALAESLAVIEDAIAQIIPHDGLSAYIDGEYRTRGIAPGEAQFKALIPALNTSATSQIVKSEELASIIPAAGEFADAVVGALMIPVSRRPRDYVVLWRRELKRTVTWAGNPEKPVVSGPHGDRLTPRKSFAAWRESVDGRSAPWTEEEIGIAENLRVTLLEVVLRITDEAMQERAKAQERQELLIAELNHRVRNILTLIRGLIGQSRGEAKNIEEFADLVGGRIRALAMAHDNITREQWEPASLHGLIRAEAEAYLTSKIDRVLIEGDDVLVVPEAYTVLALVLHEMMTNSAKYGALCDSRGTLTVTTGLDQHRDLRIEWRERGGPPVQAPEREGFGTTIIERSIPFELGGAADVRYRLGGVEADFIVPSRLIRAVGNLPRPDQADSIMSIPSPTPAQRDAHRGQGVLVVEDSMIIAMDTEDALRGLGFESITIASSSDMALQAIKDELPRFALLDFNLGGESSEPVAAALAKKGVPFWFATGYGDAVEKLSDAGALGVLQKPYSYSDLERLVAQVDRIDGKD